MCPFAILPIEHLPLIHTGNDLPAFTSDRIALNLSLDLPVVITVVDTEEKIMAIVPEVEAMVEHGLITVQKVQMGRKAKK
ncbi:MAG: hypothetical protein CVV30_00475 [Methanomicrobiales archaeon HGW-Methanomicrobiales-1]|jgi:PII-like signaling protein|nr:MAG: hypothetical protein CVV30_00475 [Methanomicrobiales archaeon HGW-Methanomicrobiales-1]